MKNFALALMAPSLLTFTLALLAPLALAENKDPAATEPAKGQGAQQDPSPSSTPKERRPTNHPGDDGKRGSVVQQPSP
jgi:hypothetical protein